MNNKNVERGQATRAHLIDVATKMFAEHVRPKLEPLFGEGSRSALQPGLDTLLG